MAKRLPRPADTHFAASPCCQFELGAVSIGSLAISFMTFLFSFLLFLTIPEVAEAVATGNKDKVRQQKPGTRRGYQSVDSYAGMCHSHGRVSSRHGVPGRCQVLGGRRSG